LPQTTILTPNSMEARRLADIDDEEDPSLWADAWPDRALVEALQSPTDYDDVFEYGLNELLAPLRG